jgi:hypothetical protein
MNSFTATGPVARLQFASDGRWEDALHITQDTADEFKVRRWLAAASSNLAIEAFFPVTEGLAFLGVRLAALPHALQHDIILGLVSVFGTLPEMSIAAWVEKMESLVGGALFKSDPVFLELGKVNAWRTFGAVVFWPDPAGQTPIESFNNAIAANPRFLKPSDLPLAIESGFKETLPHWYGHPISIRSDAGYLVAPEIVEQVCANALNFTINKDAKDGPHSARRQP